jgi:hypothetical protein
VSVDPIDLATLDGVVNKNIKIFIFTAMKIQNVLVDRISFTPSETLLMTIADTEFAPFFHHHGNHQTASVV